MIEGNNLVLENPPQEGTFMYPGHKYPRFVNIPLYLIDASDQFGIERAEYTETRVMNILKDQINVVDKVMRHAFKSPDDNVGRDLTVFLKEGFDTEFVHVQVKASGDLVTDYKHWIKDKYFPDQQYSEELIRKWQTDNKIIIINGAETKTYQEILKDSFYPQLERIQQKALREKNMEPKGQVVLFPTDEEIQVFPEAA